MNRRGEDEEGEEEGVPRVSGDEPQMLIIGSSRRVDGASSIHHAAMVDEKSVIHPRCEDIRSRGGKITAAGADEARQ